MLKKNWLCLDLKKISLCAAILASVLFTCSFLNIKNEKSVVEEVLKDYFKGVSRKKIAVEPLLGGNSNTCYLVTVESIPYVLKIKNERNPLELGNRELFATQEAASVGTAPKLLYSTKDAKAMLLEYVPGHTIEYSEAKDIENCIKIANAMRKTHALAKNPYYDGGMLDSAHEVYQAISHIPHLKVDLDEALVLMNESYELLENIDSCSAHLHNDLNLKNIFVDDEKALFIDWEYSIWGDPFYDLSFFAIRADYNEDEEAILLVSYLQRAPSCIELERYHLTKKINLAKLCVYFNEIAVRGNIDQNELDTTTPLKKWSYYAKAMADRDYEESEIALLHYHMAKCCLQMAKSVVCDKQTPL